MRPTSPFHVKVCGITREDDAQMAVSCGVTSLGFIFCESPRRIAIAKASAISRSLPRHVERIGVFVDSPISDILSISDTVGLSGVQLSGNEDSDFARAVKDERPRLSVIKTIIMEAVLSRTEVEDFASDLIIVDSPRDSLAPRKGLDLHLVERLRPTRPFLIAGGLNAENVALYIEHLRPLGIDISSGVESHPGVKDERALRSLMKALKRTLERLPKGDRV